MSTPARTPAPAAAVAAADPAAPAWPERAAARAALRALANDTRLDLIRALVDAGDPGLAAGALAARLGLSPSRLSFHLAALEQAGLVRARRASRHIYYAADAGGLGRTIGWLLRDCCGDHPEVRSCCGDAAGQFPGTVKT